MASSNFCSSSRLEVLSLPLASSLFPVPTRTAMASATAINVLRLCIYALSMGWPGLEFGGKTIFIQAVSDSL
jgi:hypothetical protein